jgi:predicted HTH transcriptional regulator
MLSPIELLEKIALGESSSLEFKSVHIAGNKVKEPSRSDLSDEIAAFANHQGGVILFGVSDNGEIRGVDPDRVPVLIHFVSEICHDSIEPPVVDFSLDSVRVPDEAGNEKILVYIDISRSLWPHQSVGGFFLRLGDAKREMTIEQLGRRLQARSQARIIQFDEQMVSDTDKSTLRKDLFARFLRDTETEEQENDRLLKRRLLIDDEGSHRASVAGLLMCSDQSDDYLYNSFIGAVCYRGLHKDANYQLDAKDFKGPLDRQITDAFKFVERYNKVSARKEVGRTEKSQYGMRAVFEALVNAVVHRDYSKHGSKIRLFLFSDRLELYSPGALANTITVETLQDNQATRNELLARLLSEITTGDDIGGQVKRKCFLERRGEGVGIILSESEQLSGRFPVYEMLGEELRLTIFAAKSLQE